MTGRSTYLGRHEQKAVGCLRKTKNQHFCSCCPSTYPSKTYEQCGMFIGLPDFLAGSKYPYFSCPSCAPCAVLPLFQPIAWLVSTATDINRSVLLGILRSMDYDVQQHTLTPYICEAPTLAGRRSKWVGVCFFH